MTRLLLLAVAAAAFVLPGSAAADNPKLVGTVGPGFAITLKDASGSAVSHLDAGTYDIQVQDLAEEHNFHLFGPGVDLSTAVETTGTVTWTVTFKDGVYSFQCDPHAGAMHGKFSVGSVTSTSTTPPPPPPAPKPKKLVATVGPGYAISLRTPAGAKVATLKAGRYAITVRDRSASHDFHLTGVGLNKKTGVAFTGTVTWTVTLRKGLLKFRCDPHASLLHGSAKVV